MVPFTHHAKDQGVSIQLYHSSWECSPEKSRLDSSLVDFSTLGDDPSYSHIDDLDLPLIERTSDYSLVLDDCERGYASLPMSLPLNSLSADEASEGTPSLPISQRSKVSFSKSVECFEIDTLDSYSEEEYDACWYTPEEYLSMRYECIHTVQVMIGDAVPDSDDEIFCFRGLECKTGHPLQARQSRKALARKCVLEEQALNRDLKIDNPDAIAVVARQRSAPCVQAAIQVAKRDHFQDCDQWMYDFDEDDWTYSNESVKRKFSLPTLSFPSLPIAPKLSYFNILRNPIKV